MQVLFTDIDGVLNCRQTPNPRKLPYIVDQKLLVRFKRLVKDTGVTVVLTSTWRYDPAGLFSAKYWEIPFQDVLPDMPDQPRRDEVLAWLSKHPNVTRYAVLDDEDDELIRNLRGTRYFARETDQDMRRNALVRVALNIKAMLQGHKG